MPSLEKSTDDAPASMNGSEATAWVFGHNAGVADALAAAALVAEERGGADGLIIAQKIRNLLLNN
jgi:hypothetical protein